MTIKLLPGNPCQSALALFTRDDFFQLGITPGDLTLQNRKVRMLMEFIFDLLRETAGLRRDGNYAVVSCRPLKKGGGRFFIQFTEEPCGRFFVFRESDDLLDAVSQLRRREGIDWSEVRIDNSDGKYKIYIPADVKFSEHSLAVLSEYSE